MLRLMLAALSLAIAFPAPAQDAPRGTVPPGSATDGSRPADGAIKGGSILPGERGGVPQSNAPTPEQRIAKCNELSGVLRDQCLRDAQDAGAGATREPGPREPAPSAPPPQNPR